VRARDNPFSAERMHRLPYRGLEDGWPALLRRFAAQRHRGAIVGPHGSGKTTLLGELTVRLEADGFRVRRGTLRSGERRLPPDLSRDLTSQLSDRDLICLDGADELSAAAWLLLRARSRRAGGLLITTHREGRLPTLVRCRTDANLLASLVSALTAPVPTGTLPELPPATALFTKHGGDIREALRDLYDCCANA
jgi:hypothetical protein